MKKLLLFGFLLTSFTAQADIAHVRKCVSQFSSYSVSLACAGVESDSDVAAVKSCVKQFGSYEASAGCRGVKK